MARDFYEVLGVAKDADADTIKKAYRKLAMQFHPDRNPGDKEAEEKFKEAASAYEILSDSQKRAQYDRFGHQAFAGGRGGAHNFQDVEDIFASFGDIFGDLFGMGRQTRARSRTSPRRGSDLRYITEIELKEVITGVERDIEFDTDEACGTCHGSGAEKGTAPVTCTTCGGSGQVVRQQGFFSMASTCPTCHGEGQMVKNPCKSCRGQGRVKSHRKIRVNIPSGVDTGTRLRVSGEGEGGYNGGPAGDLFVEIRVKADSRFERSGADLAAEAKIPYVTMILGGEVEVPTVTGKVKLEIPRGSKQGETVRLLGEGLPALRGGRRGDLHFVLVPEFPEKISKEEEKLLREIAKLRGYSAAPEGGLFGRKK